MSRMRYINGGVFDGEELWIHPDRVLTSNELIYVTAGEVFIEEDGFEYTLKADDILFLDAEKRHRGVRQSEGVSFYWFHFRGERPVKRLHADSDRIAVLIRQLFHYENTPQYPRRMLDLMLELIMTEISVNASSPEALFLVAQISEWVRVNSDRELTVTDISGKFRYNPDYICRQFRRAYNTPLKRYIAAQRCDFIKRMLLTTDDNISEVSRRCGFDNYQNFLKFFTYHERVSPSGYRKLYYNTHMNKK